MSTLTVYDAIFQGLNQIDKPDWRRHQECAAECGIFKWLPTRPDLAKWSDLLPGHVMEFSNYLRNVRELSESTIGKYINPLRLAARWVQLYHPDAYRNLFVRGIVKKSSRTKPLRYLMPDQVRLAIPMAKAMGYPEVVAAFHFGAFAGLRMQEIINLTPESLHSDGISTGTKNEFSERLVPLLPEVRQFTNSYFSLFDSCPIKSHFTLSRRVKGVLMECATKHNDASFSMCDPHEALRTSFINLCLRSDCEVEAIRAYCGQAPNNVLSGHYADLIPSLKDMPRIRESKIEIIQTRVLDKVAQKLLQA